MKDAKLYRLIPLTTTSGTIFVRPQDVRTIECTTKGRSVLTLVEPLGKIVCNEAPADIAELYHATISTPLPADPL